MRDLVMLAAMSVIVPLALADGFVAYVLWGWTSFFSPNYYVYGFMNGVRYNLMFACIALLFLLLGKKRAQEPWSGTQKLFLVFAVHATLCAVFGYAPNKLNAEVYEVLVKGLVFCLVMPYFVTDRLRLHVLLIALAIGLGFHGVLEGAKFVGSGGGHKIVGIATSMISDNNHLAVGLLMVIPILYYLYRYSEHRLARYGFLAACILTTIAVMGTFSRGGFIGLTALGLWFILSSRNRMRSLVAVALVALVLYHIAPQTWFDRIDTINNASEDSSFLARVNAWKISVAIALHNPVLGGGFHAVQALQVWSMFKESIAFLSFIPTPPVEAMGRAAHSIYFEVLGDTGFVGLFLFLAIWVNGWRTAGAVRKIAEGRSDLRWAGELAGMLRVSLLVYAISGAAVSMAYFEMFYIVVATAAVLKRCAQAQAEREVRNAAMPARPPARELHAGAVAALADPSSAGCGFSTSRRRREG